jgi:hypothetical protein
MRQCMRTDGRGRSLCHSTALIQASLPPASFPSLLHELPPSRSAQKTTIWDNQAPKALPSSFEHTNQSPVQRFANAPAQ